MKVFLLLLLLCNVSTPMRHRLEMSLVITSGLADFPEFEVTVTINGIQSGYFNDSMEKGTLRDEFAKKFIEHFPGDLELFTTQCHILLNTHREKLMEIKQHYGQSEGVHILQSSGGCEWDDEKKETVSFQHYGYNGRNFATLDTQKMKWGAPKHETFLLKKWDFTSEEIGRNNYFYNHMCPDWLKKYVGYGGSFLQRTVPPSVSLLQKSPSSPVTCHATGFFPDRAVMFWRRDGVKLSKNVKHGDVLPNHDGSFQMSVNLLKLQPKDWGKSECVLQLVGVKEDIITKLEKTAIRSNKGSGFSSDFVIGIIASVLVLVASIGLIIWKKKNSGEQEESKEDLSSTAGGTSEMK